MDLLYLLDLFVGMNKRNGGPPLVLINTTEKSKCLTRRPHDRGEPDCNRGGAM